MAEAMVMAVVGFISRSAIGILREALQLQGARGLDLERASSRDTSDDPGPEQRLNICLVSEVFVQILATGVGTIAFIWATVVLLGGFSTFLHKVDFWVITGIVFIQAAKVVGVNSNTEAKFFTQVPPAFVELGYKLAAGRGSPREASGRNFWSYTIVPLAAGVTEVISFMALLTVVLLLLPIVAASSCIGLSIFRLVIIMRHKQYRDSGADDSKANVLRALIFFYALVLAQGGLVLIWLSILSYRSEVKEQVCSEYHLEDSKIIDKYISRTSSECIKTGVLNTINRKLVSFAIDLLHSEYSEDHIYGVQVLHTLTTVAKKIHINRAIAHIQSSPDCIARMLVLLSSKSGIDENSKVNLALIVTKISKELRLSDIDGATESISSLIDPYSMKISNNQPLIIHGLEILAKLAEKNPDNCTKIFRTEDLFPKIIAPISNKLYTVFTDAESEIAIGITEKSLRVVSKLVKGTHEINKKIRNEICEKGLVVNTIYPILESEEIRYKRLKVPAINILSQLNLVKIVGDDADAQANYIHCLMGLLFDESNESIKKAAAKALVLLASDTDSSKTHCATIMNWIKGQDDSVVVQQLSSMLSDPRSPDPRSFPGPSYRNAVAQLLTQFSVNSPDDETSSLLKPILHKVLSFIISEVDEALGSENQQRNSQQQNRRPAEFILKLLPPCIDTSSCASRQGASQHSVGDSGAPATPLQPLHALFPCLGTSSSPNQSSGGNTLQNHTVAGSQRGDGGRPAQGITLSVLGLLNRLVNVPGAYSNIRGDNAKAQLASTSIEAGSRKTLVAFLGLALQICDKLISDAAAFDAAVSDIAQLVDKLGKIIEMCNKDSVGHLKGREPSVDYLMMIKSATKLCAWIMQKNTSHVAYFRQQDIDYKLKDALEAMKGLELGVLLTYSANQLTNYKTLSSIVEEASRPIIQHRQTNPPPPSPQRRAVCCCCMFAA